MKVDLADMIDAGATDDSMAEAWRHRLRKHGVLADELAWERALAPCLSQQDLEHTVDCRRR